MAMGFSFYQLELVGRWILALINELNEGWYEWIKVISLYFSFLSEFGTGYVPAVIKSATEFKFIHRMLALAGPIGSFFVGGSTHAAIEGGIRRYIDFLSTYQPLQVKQIIHLGKSIYTCHSFFDTIFWQYCGNFAKL